MMWFWRAQRGQLSTYMIMVLAVVLLLLMVTVNVGKASFTRTTTSNASDAGALAAASFLASGENVIKDMGNFVFLNYLGWVAGQLMTFRSPYSNLWVGYASQIIFWLNQDQIRDTANDAGEQARKAADETAYLYAFANANIDDPHTDDVEAFLDACPDEFEDHCEDAPKPYMSGRYQWEDRQGPNVVQVDVDGLKTPFVPNFIPGPVVFSACPPPVPSVCVAPPGQPLSVFKAGMETSFGGVLRDIVSQFSGTVVFTPPSNFIGPPSNMQINQDLMQQQGQSLKQQFKDGIAGMEGKCMAVCLVPCPGPCPPYIVIEPTLPWTLPAVVPMMFSHISNSDGEARVRVTRNESGDDLRLWEMQYFDPQNPRTDAETGVGGIRSGGMASWGGGDVIPFSGNDYDAQLSGAE